MSGFPQELMNPLDNKVSLEIPLDKEIKIFAFLFKEDYTMPQLKEVGREFEVVYYGQSEPFSIDANTNNLSLSITLIQVEQIDVGTGTGGGTYTTIAPIIEQVTAVTFPTSNSTPNYTFASTKAGSISYGGSCYSATIIANIGNNTIVFNALIDGYYDDCTIKVTDSDGNESNTLTIPPFTVDTTVQYTPAPTVTFSPANGAIGVDISGNITITFSEAVRNSINNTELTDSNIDSHITLKYNDASGSNIDFDATINTDKKVITINPTSNLPNSQAVYVAIGATLEDYADNLITAATATFTTTVGLVDIDGNVYRTVVIGTQHWMAENLKVTKYRNGDNITHITDNSSDWASNTDGAYGYYNDNTTNSDTYGMLYNWYAVDNSSGLCPQGWHVPTDSEFTNLKNGLGSNAAAQLKEKGTVHWGIQSTGTNNSSGFTARGAGLRDYSTGYYGVIRNYTYFWTSTTSGSTSTYRYLNASSSTTFGSANTFKRYGFSIRCLED